ncbi:MAG: Rdx family protein [Phycisphaerae bacterium]|nr:selenoprotein [Phycisphaerae bacterium]MCZ2398537.1 Rdx family protein [Phycisphaerae bacterium]NUQ50693.1 selenoprotein [Phycisphaerae bacterium]
MPKAAGLAAEIKRRFGVEPRLIEGRGGVFDVTVDNTMVYSKHQTGRFPEFDEIASAIAARRGNNP